MPRRDRPGGRARLAAVLATLALLGAGCRGGEEPSGAAVAPGPSGTLTVFAASSLTEAFKDLGAGFTRANPGVEVRFNFAGSQALAGQIRQGAPADVFAAADQRNMGKVADAGQVLGQPSVFARNLLQIVVAKGNPAGVKGLADLARPDLKVVLAAEAVPVGAYSRQALAEAGVRVRPVSLEENVKAVVGKVALGEADAGIAYLTDVAAATDKVQGVDIPAGHNVSAAYPVAVVKATRNAAAAEAFVRYLLSEAGQSKLRSYGFLPAAGA